MRSVLPLPLDRVSDHTFIPSLVPADGVVLDLGANKGTFSKTVRKRYGWRCYAVEPNPAVWREIESDEDLQTFNLAVSDRDGPVDLNLSGNTESSSLLPLSAEPSSMVVRVEAVTLPTFLQRQQIPRVDLLKVDIEGAEIRLFQSLPDQLLVQIGQIAVEFHELMGHTDVGEIRSLMRRMDDLGFAVFKMSFSHYADVLFVNRRLAGATRGRLLLVKLVSRNARVARRLLRRIGLLSRP